MCNRSWVMRAGSTLWAALAIAVSLFASPLRAQFVYVANYHDNNVSGYTINPSTGALTAFAGSPFPAGSGPISVAVDPSGMFAYVAADVSPSHSSLFGYRINPSTGALTAIAGSPFGQGPSYDFVAVDPSGKFVYAANWLTGKVEGYRINPCTGALTAIAGSPFITDSDPTSIAIDPSGKFAYVANGESDNVSGYRINRRTGVLTAIAGSPFPTGVTPFSVAVARVQGGGSRGGTR